MVGCGGGESAPVSNGGSGDSGTVAILISDAAEDLDQLLITVTEVALIPSGDGQPVSVFYDPAGCEIDLLGYQDDDFLLKLADVPTGYYEKVRLRVRNVTAVGGNSPCSGNVPIKLPSGKIDLVDRRGTGFYVRAGQVLAISLDVDVPKSINLHLAGNSGRCIFRPVVFVDIAELEARRSCPYFLRGIIEDITYVDSTPLGFTLRNQRGDFQIVFSNDPETVFFDENGFRAGEINSILKQDAPVGVFGQLRPDGLIEALAVVVGDVSLTRGVVQTAVVDDHFTLQTPGQGSLEVEVRDPLVTVGCGEEDRVPINTIQPGFRAKVLGLRPPSSENANDRFVAVVVFLKRELRGYLREVETTGETVLKIEYSLGQFTEIELPNGTPIYMAGDGVIALDDLQARVDCADLESLQVRIILPFDAAAQASAPEVLIRPDRLYGTVTKIELYNRLLEIENAEGRFKVYLRYGAFIVLDVGGYDLPVSLYDIQIGDTVTLFGLASCGTTPDFDAYIVLTK
jgi:hypothetical protein